MNSVTAHRPLRDTAGAVSLRYRCSVPPSPRHHAFCFDLARFPFSFFRYGGGESEVGFLLWEKLTEFKCGLGFAKLFFWGFGFGKTETEFPARRRGLGRNPRGVSESVFGGGYKLKNGN